VKAAFGYDDFAGCVRRARRGRDDGSDLTGILATSVINPIFGAGKATGTPEGNLVSC